ncbi:MAG: translation initiation factor IF-3 [Rickettsiales bacterium]|nr:translation initiation factor IF-3 [Rickettsiales bacterium]
MRPNKQNFSKKNNDNFFRSNEEIRSSEVRVIDQDGNMLGVMSVSDGVKKAKDVGLDLVEVSPNASPPVCRIASVGKMKYEMQKKSAGAKKKQKQVEVKEIKMTINIGKGDYDTKLRRTKDFIEKGHKVKVSIRMKGREITHKDIAAKMMEGILLVVEEFAKPEVMPRMEGMQMVTILIKK